MAAALSNPAAQGLAAGSRRPTAAPQQIRPTHGRRHAARPPAALPPELAAAAATATATTLAALPTLEELPSWAAPLGGTVLGVGILLAARLATYSQLEYIAAAMLGRHVKAGGARVVQLGGTTRDLFYYPAGTVQVTVGGPDVAAGLWEQAGMQAKVPIVVAKGQAPKVLASQPGASADSIVLLDQLAAWGDDAAAAAAQAFRVLKPGGTLILIQRLPGGPAQALLASGAGAVDPTRIDAVQMFDSWDFVQVDAALQGTDPHAVGVCVKPLSPAGSRDRRPEGSVDATAFEALLKRGKDAQQRQEGGSSGGFGQQQQQKG